MATAAAQCWRAELTGQPAACGWVPLQTELWRSSSHHTWTLHVRMAEASRAFVRMEGARQLCLDSGAASAAKRENEDLRTTHPRPHLTIICFHCLLITGRPRADRTREPPALQTQASLQALPDHPVVDSCMIQSFFLQGGGGMLCCCAVQLSFEDQRVFTHLQTRYRPGSR